MNDNPPQFQDDSLFDDLEFRALVEHNPDVIFRLDGKNLTYIYCNPAAETLFGNLSQIRGKTLENTGIEPFLLDLWTQEMAQVQQSRQESFFECPFPNENSELWLQIRVVPEWDISGNLQSFLCVARDISEHKLIEIQLQQKIEREHLVNQTALKIRQSLNLDDILFTTVAEIRNILKCDRVLVYQFDSDYNGRVVAESVEKGWTVTFNLQIEDPCFRLNWVQHYIQGRKTTIENVSSAKIKDCYKDLLNRFQVKANLVVPLLIQNSSEEEKHTTNLWGLLIVHQCSRGRIWREHELELMDKIAIQLSIAIQQSELYQLLKNKLHERKLIEDELRKLNQDLESRVNERIIDLKITNEQLHREMMERDRQEQKSRLLTEITLKIRQSLDINQILDTAVKEIHRLLDCDRVLIYQVFENGTGKTITEAVKPGWICLLNLEFPEELFPLEHQKVYRQGIIKSIPDIQKHYQLVTPCLLESLQKWQVKAKLVVPIIQQENLWGFMIAHNCSQPRHWQDWEIKLMQQLAEQIAIAVAQAKLLSTLQERELFIRTVADSSPNIIYIYDLNEGKNIYCNRAIINSLGYTPEDIQEMDLKFLASLLHPDDLPRMLQYLESLKTLNEQEIRTFEYRFRDRQKQWRSYLSYDTAFKRDDDGRVVQIIGVAQDITQRKNAEKAIQKQNKLLKIINEKLSLANAELDRSSRLKDEFLASMSHELRTPLNSVLGLSEVLTEGTYGALNEQQQKAINTIINNGQHLLELINDILDLSKIEAGKLSLEIAPVSVRKLCDNSLSCIRQQAEKKHITVTSNIGDICGTVEVDELRIRQVLINLLSNAVKFTPEGGKISLEVQAGEQELRFLVIDTGIGIASQDQHKLFQAFVQLDSSLSRRYEGTGLGLALVKKLVEMHGGTVALESELGQGSCFIVSLPWHPQRIFQEKSLSSSRFTPYISDSRQVLLAEDNPSQIMTLSNFLKTKNLQVVLASEQKEIITKAQQLKPKAIIINIQMSDLNGLEIIHQVRSHQETANIPIIVITTAGNSQECRQYLVAGANEYLIKPLRLGQLIASWERPLNP